MRFAIAVAALLLSSPAGAQWYYQGEDSAFGDGGIHLALTGSGEYAFGIRCENGEMTALLVTPEQISNSDAITLQAVSPEMLVRVDNNDVFEFDAGLDSANGALRVSAEIEHDLADQIASAKQRVSVALSALGERYHEQKFNVRGSTRVVQRLMRECGVTSPD